MRPAWSPDGRTLAFLRRLTTDRGELLLIPALGGAERKLAEIRCEFRTGLCSPAWSPDGRWLAVSHRDSADMAEGLFLVSSLTGDKRRLTVAPRGFTGDYRPAFSPDGRILAFVRLSGWSAGEVHLLPLTGDFTAAGEPRRITTGGGGAPSPVWTRDGSRILYLFTERAGAARRELRIIAFSGSAGAKRVPLLEDDFADLSLGRHLVYSRRTADTNIWRAEIGRRGASPEAPQRLISSTRQDGLARYSPDGKKIAFHSNRSGTSEIWIADSDGSNPLQLTALGGSMIGVMAWSPDGRQLVFHGRHGGQADLFTISSTGGIPKQLTNHPSDDLVPSYSQDGRWIYFCSWRSGVRHIWRMPAEGDDATQITHTEGGYMPMESPDGKTLYYCHVLPEKGIWKVPVQGGKEMQVAGPYSPRLCGLAVTADGIYYTAGPSSGKHSIQFASFTTGESRPLVLSDQPIGELGVSVSPDQRFVLYTQPDQSGSDLMLIENFDAR
jgi:Tol biopolymer transport system component